MKTYQIVNGLVGGIIVKYLYGGEAIFAIVAAGIFLIIAAVSVLYVHETDRSYLGKISLAKLLRQIKSDQTVGSVRQLFCAGITTTEMRFSYAL